MKKSRLLLCQISLLLVLVGACKKSPLNSDSKVSNNYQQGSGKEDTQKMISKTNINTYIADMLRTKKDFKWAYTSEEMVWSALNQSDKVLSIGYKPAGWSKDEVVTQMHNINLQSEEWVRAKKEILQLVWEEEIINRPDLKIEELEVWPEKYVPVICVSVERLSTIKKLRQSNLVRYAEPIGYNYTVYTRETNTNQTSSTQGFGCADNSMAYSGNLRPSIDYYLTSPSIKVPWNYTHHNIPAGWTESSGKGIKVMVIDTGCSERQENLGSDFNQGESVGRNVEHLVTLPRSSSFLGILRGPQETPHDACGHGTLMAGIVAAPRGTDGNACGIAYNCDLVTVRAAQDVVLDESREAKGVADAFNVAANRSDIKIVTMSMGYPFYVSQIADAVQNAINRGKLVFCAAGTTTSWTNWLGVIFPANMPGVNAVTGIQDNKNVRCHVCHEGSKVDFVVVMEKGENRLEALTVATSGDAPATVGGSSAATASMAGMAAMVWSKYPEKSATEILNLLKKHSTNPSGNRNWGSGLLDVAKALNVDHSKIASSR